MRQTYFDILQVDADPVALIDIAARHINRRRIDKWADQTRRRLISRTD
jgi:hypothetical protein